MLREPLLIIAAFLILFFTVIVYVRLDFSISSSKPGKGSGAHAPIVENVLRRHAKRANVYENFDSQLGKLKTNKDATAFQNALKVLTADHKTETQAINEIVTKHRTEAPELAEK
jgi:oligosaccharyltransferase complex subunit alpha (ribophorin I)